MKRITRAVCRRCGGDWARNGFSRLGELVGLVPSEMKLGASLLDSDLLDISLDGASRDFSPPISVKDLSEPFFRRDSHCIPALLAS
jgi:hypothetical protein